MKEMCGTVKIKLDGLGIRAGKRKMFHVEEVTIKKKSLYMN